MKNGFLLKVVAIFFVTLAVSVSCCGLWRATSPAPQAETMTAGEIVFTVLPDSGAENASEQEIPAKAEAPGFEMPDDDALQAPETVHIHIYAATVTKAASCGAKGIRTYQCGCGSAYTEFIPETGHKYAGKDGAERICTACSASGEDRSSSAACAEGEPHTHNYRAAILIAPTCEEAGVRRYECLICGEMYTEMIPAIG